MPTRQLRPVARPRHGFFLLSLQRDVEATLSALAALGFADGVRRITVPAPGGKTVAMAVITAPDGVLVELIGPARMSASIASGDRRSVGNREAKSPSGCAPRATTSWCGTCRWRHRLRYQRSRCGVGGDGTNRARARSAHPGGDLRGRRCVGHAAGAVTRAVGAGAGGQPDRNLADAACRGASHDRRRSGRLDRRRFQHQRHASPIGTWGLTACRKREWTCS